MRSHVWIWRARGMASLNPIDDFFSLKFPFAPSIDATRAEMPIPPPRKDRYYIKNRRRVEDFLKVPSIRCGGRPPYCRCLGSAESQHLDLVTGCVNSSVKTLLAINIVNLRKKK